MSIYEITAIEAKVRLINQYEEIASDAKAKADAIKSEIKDLMTEKKVDTIKTPNFVIRFIDVLSSRFDTKRFKETFGEELYKAYTKEVASKKFTITQ